MRDVERFNPKRFVLTAGGVLLVLLLAGLAVLAWVAVPFLVDLEWFGSLGYEGYFWERFLYRYGVFLLATGAFTLFFLVNFSFALRQVKRADRLIFRAIRVGGRLLYIPLSILLGGLISYPLFRNWEALLFSVFGPPTGTPDPVFGLDVSFYLFRFPVFELVKNQAFVALLVLFVLLALFYALERRLLALEGEKLPGWTSWHLGGVLTLAFLVRIFDLVLQRYGFVYTTGHEPLFSGPGFLEMDVLSPLILAEIAVLTLTALAAARAVVRRRGLVAVVALGVAVLLVIGLRQLPVLPDLVEKYIVKPNEFVRERPFMEMNIRATLDAYKLGGVEIRQFKRQRTPAEVSSSYVQQFLRNVPLWGAEQLRDVYDQLQELRTYYDFPAINVDRYSVAGAYHQVFLAGRELNPTELPPSAQNWVNRHLTYTHGYGLVMTPANQAGDEPMAWFIRGIPLDSDYGFKVAQPELYYGVGSHPGYVVAPNATGELGYPMGDSFRTTNYEGTGGVPVGSLFGRFLLSAYFRDKDLLFSTQLTARSRALIRRNIQERIRRLTPFLLLDNSPYLVVTPKRMYWVQDAYTRSRYYPASQANQLDGVSLNYIRNSVKIIIDAYNGTVSFFLFDPQDPVVTAYSRIYPGLLKSMDRMPDELKKHLRYPKDLFELQMHVYGTYHQTDPRIFYEQEDAWKFARTVHGEGAQEIRPYYLTLDLIRQGRFEFSLFQPMAPKARENLRALVVAGCDGADYGKLVAYLFPKGEIVYSPVQMEALINADPDIARQFTLWSRAQTDVVRGNMIILPQGKSILYVQPVYLKSRARFKIPELQRVIMTDGQVAVMRPSLAEAYQALRERLKQVTESR